MNKQFTIKGLPNDLLTNEIVNERKLKTDGTAKDYMIEVKKGNVPGAKAIGWVFCSETVTTAFEDLWGGAGDMIYPTTNETWEVRSSDVNDTLGGTGSHSIVQKYLDDNFIEKTVTVPLDGTNWVSMNSDMFRPDGAVAIPSGSNKRNHGTITVRDVATLNERQIIPVLGNTGLGTAISQDTHYTVPVGKTAYILKFTPFFPKNEDGSIGSSTMINGTNTWISPGALPFYQAAFDVVFEAPFELPEKTDLKYGAISTINNVPFTVCAIIELLVLDNNV